MPDLYILTPWAIAQPEPVSLSDAASRVFVTTILIGVLGFGAALWLRARKNKGLTKHQNAGIIALFTGRINRKEAHDIVVTDSRRLSASQTLVSVNWEGEIILLGCTNNTISVLATRLEVTKDLKEGRV